MIKLKHFIKLSIINLIIDSNAPKFTSIKFYPINSDTPVTELEYGVQYKIVVMVE